MNKLLGHTCEGLKEHFKAAEDSACVPRFTDEGTIQGCDDENRVTVIYCPYCGEKLKAATRGGTVAAARDKTL